MDFVLNPSQKSSAIKFMPILRHLLAVSTGVSLILLSSPSLRAQPFAPAGLNQSPTDAGLTAQQPLAPSSVDKPSPPSHTPLVNPTRPLDTQPSLPLAPLPPAVDPNPQSPSGVAVPPSPSNPANASTQPLTPQKRIFPASNTSLNPSGNPLNFPTQSSEVTVTQRKALTLQESLDLALKNNTQLQSARLTLEQSLAELESARSALLPTLDTTATFSRDNSAESNRQTALLNLQPGVDNQSDPGTSVSGDLRLNYDIYTGGERSAQIERANKTVELNRLEVDRTSAEVRFEATDRYYRLQNADAQIAIAQAAVEENSQSLRDAQLLERAGLGTRFDTLRAEGDLATANQNLTSAISEQRIARRRLVEYLNLGQNVELTAADEIREAKSWPLALEPTIVLAYKNRAELEQQLVQREISEQDSYIALAGIKPRVNLVAQYQYVDDFDDPVGVATGYSFQAQFRWRLFDGGRAFADARRAYRQMDIANTNFSQQRNQIREQVEENYFTLISNQENITSTRKNVERFEEALRLARLRFQAGVGTQTDVINAQRDLTDARGRFLQAIIGYNRSLNGLQRSVSNLPDSNLFKVH